MERITSGSIQIIVPLLIFIFVVFYYSIIDTQIGRLAKPLAKRLTFSAHYSVAENKSIWKIIVVSSGQILFALILAFLFNVNVFKLIVNNFEFKYIFYGLVLGIGLMAFSSFLVQVIIRVNMLISHGGPKKMETWQSLSKGGWMREYLNLFRAIPLPAAIMLTLFYVSFEEIIFRGILISHFVIYGKDFAIIFSAMLFAVIQVFQQPSWRTALFPAVGSIVIGVVHGLLFVDVPNIVPLIVAHFCFFLVAVL